MSAELQRLRATVAEVKAAPIYTKAAKAEQVMDALIGVLVQQSIEIAKLKLTISDLIDSKEVENGKG